MEEPIIKLERATFEFSQDANCLSSVDEFETLIIECESDLGIDRTNECFFVLKTEKWSMDNVEELKLLFDRIEKVIIKDKKPSYIEALKNDRKWITLTPKEYAKELVERMFSLSTTNAFPAKQCAIIAVDKIIIALNYHQWQNTKQIDYFIEVRKEIESYE